MRSLSSEARSQQQLKIQQKVRPLSSLICEYINAGSQSTFVGALMTCLDEKDEEMVLLLFAYVFNL